MWKEGCALAEVNPNSIPVKEPVNSLKDQVFITQATSVTRSENMLHDGYLTFSAQSVVVVVSRRNMIHHITSESLIHCL